MSSTNYQIQWDAIGQGGENTSSSTTYKLRDTFGNMQGISTSSSYRVDAGFRGGIYDPTVGFSVFSQVRSSQVAATVLATTTVTVTTTSGYSVGDYIAVIQNEGASQVAAIGRVTAVGGTTLTVDEFHNGGTAPTIDGTNDYVYRLSGTSLPFGNFSDLTVTTGIVGWEAAADVSSGYSVYVFEDTNLTDGVNTIPDVGGGAVDVGTSEYGARSSDTSLASSTFDTEDAGITSSPQQVASRTDNSIETRDFLTLKVAVSGTQPAGTYAQVLTLIFVGNY